MAAWVKMALVSHHVSVSAAPVDTHGRHGLDAISTHVVPPAVGLVVRRHRRGRIMTRSFPSAVPGPEKSDVPPCVCCVSCCV